MENQLFDWKDWDSIDEGAVIYYECILKVPIGSHLIGTKIESIIFDVQGSELQIGNEKYKLIISIGEKIDE